MNDLRFAFRQLLKNPGFTAVAVLALALKAAGATTESFSPDLQTLAEGRGGKAYRIATEWVADDGGKPALKMKTVPGEDGFVVLSSLTFTNGVIEFDAKGKSGPPQSNFLGIAFRVENGTNYDTVYFRPFNFRVDDPEKRKRAVQYMSLPDWPWPRLRAELTGQYEKPIEPAPDGDGWFHAKVVIQKPTVSIFVNGDDKPSLVVKELSARKSGSVGLWCNGFGSIANLRITPQP